MKFKIQEIEAADFSAIDKNEKIFYIYIGHLGNEITVLEKLLHLSTTFDTTDEHLGPVNAAQILMVERLIGGKLFEGWILLGWFFDFGGKAPKLPISIYSDLSDNGRAAFDKIKAYFNSDNLLDVVRNQFSFHYTAGNLNKRLPPVEELGKLKILVTEKDEPYAIFSEQIMLDAILYKIDSTNLENAFIKLLTDVQTITRTFRIFCAECLVTMSQKHRLNPSNFDNELPGADYNRKINLPLLFSGFK